VYDHLLTQAEIQDHLTSVNGKVYKVLQFYICKNFSGSLAVERQKEEVSKNIIISLNDSN
jgi:hypothetical protein